MAITQGLDHALEVEFPSERPKSRTRRFGFSTKFSKKCDLTQTNPQLGTPLGLIKVGSHASENRVD